MHIWPFLRISLLALISSQIFGADSDQTIARLVKDGSESAIKQLYEIARSKDNEMRASALRGIVSVARRQLIDGDLKQARRHANNIWLSSSPHDARQLAWKIIFLTENHPTPLPEGHRVTILSPGGRDHDRFEAWLNERTVASHDWIIGMRITYEPTLISPGRADENAKITFVLQEEPQEKQLLNILAISPSKYPTEQWSIIRLESLGSTKAQNQAVNPSRR